KPDHIRRPANQFMIYLSERRKEFKDKYPNCKSNDLNKHVSVQWNKLSSQEKEPYKKKSLEVAERHKAQHPGYEYKP
ncbi:high mobility group box, partial [Guyanagaster necrorhizus]